MNTLLLLLLACNQPQQTKTQANQPEQQPPTENLDQGQKHPPIPENNPVWEWDAGGFVPDFGWYGEHNWMDVRMRVVGHLSAAGRDLARTYAMNGDLKQATQAYKNLHQILSNIPSPQSGYSAQINSLLSNAAKRDYKRIQALHEGTSPLISKTGSIAVLRERYYQLAIQSQPGKDVSKQAQLLQKDLQAQLIPRPELKIDEFKDFTDRHKLRVRLFDAYLDSLDPLSIDERWGYWQPIEIDRQIIAIGWATGQLGGEDWTPLVQERFEITPQLSTDQPTYLWPSLVVEQLTSPDQKTDLSPDEFGRLPTGDTLIDVAGHPGPKGIGTLMKWNVQDSKHRKFLQTTAQKIGNNLSSPEQAIQIARDAIKKLDQATHGSRFYNIKQLRNATVRQLARSGAYTEAYTLFMDNFPLHHQDWACPNRKGLLLAVAGRLLAEGKSPKALETLQSSIDSSMAFLEKVNLAEQGKITSPRPPGLNGRSHTQRGPHNPPKNHQTNQPKPPHQKNHPK